MRFEKDHTSSLVRCEAGGQSEEGTMMFREIVVPLDATSASAAALPLGCGVALAARAGLTLVRVVPGATALDDPQVAAARAAVERLAATLDLPVTPGLAIRVIPVHREADVPATIV